ncbi:MAG: hypothetical protein AMJ56_00700 [Anaerolineae bacterium SG8_19]|nr:MAG: hypothetical protein AMJ56_00700 [Anaerolineae bacterium SG8_19]
MSPNKLSNTVQILTSTALHVKSMAAALLRDSAERPNGIRPRYAGRAVGKKPVNGSLAVQNVDTERVLKILQSIWATKPETAGCANGRRYLPAVLSSLYLPPPASTTQQTQEQKKSTLRM